MSRLVYDMFVKSILQIVSKLDLSVQKVSGEEVRPAGQHRRPLLVKGAFNALFITV